MRDSKKSQFASGASLRGYQAADGTIFRAGTMGFAYRMARKSKEDRELFASFLGYDIKDSLQRFHESKENLSLFFEELKELRFSWDGRKMVTASREG